MLSYKLKHLCSQVFASLAAFGLFSLGSGEARAAVQGTGTTFNFAGKAENFTVTASWSNQCTVPSTFKGIQGGTYDSGYGGCMYTCKAGYYSNLSGLTTVGGQTGSGSSGGSGSGSSAIYVPAADCYPRPTSCVTGIWNEANVYISKTLNTPTMEFTAGQGFYCKANCLAGFAASTASGAASYQKTAYATSTAALTVPACVGKKYIMTIDCGGGSFEGLSSSKGTGIAYYGKKITLPGSGACSWSGHILDGFDVPSSAISK